MSPARRNRTALVIAAVVFAGVTALLVLRSEDATSHPRGATQCGDSKTLVGDAVRSARCVATEIDLNTTYVSFDVLPVTPWRQ